MIRELLQQKAAQELIGKAADILDAGAATKADAVPVATEESYLLLGQNQDAGQAVIVIDNGAAKIQGPDGQLYDGVELQYDSTWAQTDVSLAFKVPDGCVIPGFTVNSATGEYVVQLSGQNIETFAVANNDPPPAPGESVGMIEYHFVMLATADSNEGQKQTRYKLDPGIRITPVT